MARLMTVMLILSVMFISCGGQVTTDTEPEEGISPTAFSCSNDADCELTGFSMLVTTTEDCSNCPLTLCGARAVSPEESQMRREAFEEYCGDLNELFWEEDLNCPVVDCIGCPLDTSYIAKCVNNVCQDVCE